MKETQPTELFLPRGNLAREMYSEYQSALLAEFAQIDVLRTSSLRGDILVGGNPFVAVLFNRIARKFDYKLATQLDLEKNMGPDNWLLGTREFTGLVIRDSKKEDSYLSKNLKEQLLTRGKILKTPILISLTDLEIALDAESPHGLSFKLNRDSRIHSSQDVLNIGGNFLSHDFDLETGLPKKAIGGGRILYVSDSPLSALSLSWSLSINAGGYGLISSKEYNEYVRMPLVKITQ